MKNKFFDIFNMNDFFLLIFVITGNTSILFNQTFGWDRTLHIFLMSERRLQNKKEICKFIFQIAFILFFIYFLLWFSISKLNGPPIFALPKIVPLYGILQINIMFKYYWYNLLGSDIGHGNLVAKILTTQNHVFIPLRSLCEQRFRAAIFPQAMPHFRSQYRQ